LSRDYRKKIIRVRRQDDMRRGCPAYRRRQRWSAIMGPPASLIDTLIRAGATRDQIAAVGRAQYPEIASSIDALCATGASAEMLVDVDSLERSAAAREAARRERGSVDAERIIAALGYVGRGWPVFPMIARDGKKRPLTSHGLGDATSSCRGGPDGRQD
jgi:hypothetical protein